MTRREDMGSWLEGTPPSRRLDLPARGRGSMASVPRRLVGLAVDWGLASLISYAFLDYHPLASLAVFGVSTWVLVATLGHTIGHRVAGVQVVRVVDLAGAPGPDDGTTSSGPRVWPAPGPVLAFTRTALLCLGIPAAVWDSSGRGLHDVAAATVPVRA
ncbi:RDD family protein [Actinotalea sp. AC32]|nr:RDD family protein [Actinotalea sp. AC32]